MIKFKAMHDDANHKHCAPPILTVLCRKEAAEKELAELKGTLYRQLLRLHESQNVLKEQLLEERKDRDDLVLAVETVADHYQQYLDKQAAAGTSQSGNVSGVRPRSRSSLNMQLNAQLAEIQRLEQQYNDMEQISQQHGEQLPQVIQQKGRMHTALLSLDETCDEFERELDVIQAYYPAQT